MAHLVEFRLRNIEELLEEIDEQNAAVGKAVSYTVKDIKSRAPGWIAEETASKYNIKKSDVNPSRTKNNPAVSISISGDTLESIALVYVGRNLTPIHFSMSPKTPKKHKLKGKLVVPGPIYERYAITYEVIKGSRWKARGKPDYEIPFLAPIRRGNNKYIIYQRLGKSRKKMYSVRTVSVPQMVGNNKVKSKIEERIMGAAEQRLRHHLDRFSHKNN